MHSVPVTAPNRFAAPSLFVLNIVAPEATAADIRHAIECGAFLQAIEVHAAIEEGASRVVAHVDMAGALVPTLSQLAMLLCEALSIGSIASLHPATGTGRQLGPEAGEFNAVDFLLLDGTHLQRLQ